MTFSHTLWNTLLNLIIAHASSWFLMFRTHTGRICWNMTWKSWDFSPQSFPFSILLRRFETYRLGVFSSFTVLKKVALSSLESTYSASGMTNLSLPGKVSWSHSWFRINRLCRSTRTAGVSPSPNINFSRVSHIFFSQCITSRLCLQGRSCTQTNFISEATFVTYVYLSIEQTLFVMQNAFTVCFIINHHPPISLHSLISIFYGKFRFLP